MKTVLCHGVFDLLHFGHTEHLRKARLFGDYMIVSVVAVVRRGNAPCGFRVVAVSQGPDGVLSVQYKATEGPKSAPGRTWANVLVLSVPRGPYKMVVWVENGKEVHRR